MRKVDFVIVLGVIALGAAGWQMRGGLNNSPVKQSAAASPFPQGSQPTRSGRWSVLPNRYGYAGFHIGMSQAEARDLWGEPSGRNQENQESSTWTYSRDGGELHLAWLEDRLIMVGGTGPWALGSDPGRASTPVELPRVGHDAGYVKGLFGPPGRKDENAWVYSTKPGELTFHFDRDRVSQIVVTGEIAPRRLSQ